LRNGWLLRRPDPLPGFRQRRGSSKDGADDEPSLGSPSGGESQMAWSAGADHDGEMA